MLPAERSKVGKQCVGDDFAAATQDVQRSWDRPSRSREVKAPTGPKVRWLRDLHLLEPNLPRAKPQPAQGDFWQLLIGQQASN